MPYIILTILADLPQIFTARSNLMGHLIKASKFWVKRLRFRDNLGLVRGGGRVTMRTSSCWLPT